VSKATVSVLLPLARPSPRSKTPQPILEVGPISDCKKSRSARGAHSIGCKRQDHSDSGQQKRARFGNLILKNKEGRFLKASGAAADERSSRRAVVLQHFAVRNSASRGGRVRSSTRKLHPSGSFASGNVPIGSPTATSLPPENATIPVHFARAHGLTGASCCSTTRHEADGRWRVSYRNKDSCLGYQS
jgi:hypothetical protein